MPSSSKSAKSDESHKLDHELDKHFGKSFDKFLNKRFMKRHKAQFFVLSAFAIVAVFYVVSGWIEAYTIVDTSQVALIDEIFIFNNIKEKTGTVVKDSKTCEDLTYNLQEYKDFVESYALSKGYSVTFAYMVTPCNPTFPLPVYFAQINLTLQSPRATLNSQFSYSWPS